MTDEQIIKALECCKYSVNNKDCGRCPYVECETQIGCVGELLTNTLDLIKRQRAENKELIEDNAGLNETLINLLEQIKNIKKEIKELKQMTIDKAKNGIVCNKEDFVNILVSCDWWSCKVKSSPEMSPSTSIEELAEYLVERFKD